ncbi:MAG: hypothetical protein ACOYNZ_10395 [Rhodoferax sp.]
MKITIAERIFGDEPRSGESVVMLRRLLTWNGLLACLLLSACSAYAPADALIGMSREELVVRMGQPDMERQYSDAIRLEFPRGPFGTHTWFVYLDKGGRVGRAEQVLNEQNFSLVNAGMSQRDVLELLGRPGEVQLLGRSRGVVWSYRYENNSCLWFQVELSLDHLVRSAGYGDPPECRGLGERSN